MKVLPTMGSMYSGSLRGLTASHNKGGLYLRGRTVPTNPNTSRQQVIRLAMGAASQSWSDTLDEPTRQSWRDYAQQVDVVDSLGQTMQLSGVNWYTMMAVIVQQVLDSGLSDTTGLPDFNGSAPGVANTGAPPGPVSSATVNFTTPPGSISIGGNMADPAPADGLGLLYVGNPVTPGTRFYKGPYQLAASTIIEAEDTVWGMSPALGNPAQWVSDTLVTPANVEAYFPVRVRIVYSDGRVSQQLRELIQFEDVTP